MNFIWRILKTVFSAKSFSLLFVLRYTFLFTALLVFLPFTAFDGVPIHDVLGGIFLELTPLSVGLVTTGFLATAWSLMFIQGILIDAVRTDRAEAPTEKGAYRGVVRGGPISERAQEFFNLCTTPTQRWVYFGVALPGIVIIVTQAQENQKLAAALCAVLASVASYLIMIVLCYPAKAVDPDYQPMLKSKSADVIYGFLGKFTVLTSFLKLLHEIFSSVVRGIALLFPPLRCAFHKDGRLRTGHFFATFNFFLLTAIFLLVAVFLPPTKPIAPPSGIYLFIMVSLMVWTWGSLQFFLSRYHIPPWLVLVLMMAIGYWLTHTHHVYSAPVIEVAADEPALDPVTVVKAGKHPESKNLVVVAATGGGILASGWFTVGMERLIQERPAIKEEVRLVSTVSGSSTGAAFYLDGLVRHEITPDSDSAAVREALASIYAASTDSSLAASTYGFAFLDFWRMASGGIVPPTREDRGTCLEQQWLLNARRRGGDSDVGSLSLHDLRAGIRAGTLPAAIFNGTVMELGQRVMMTPVDFTRVSPNASEVRARTLNELYSAPAGRSVDPSIWTAARMSATFPYVTPAARADFDPPLPLGGNGSGSMRDYHLIDGGYYDNYGIASTMDWLDPVLRAREAGELDFERLLIIQLRAYQVPRTGSRAPSSATKAALFGPLIGIVNIYAGAALTRDEMAMNRYLDAWNERLGPKGAVVRTAVMERRSTSGPLSWHLTNEQIATIRKDWPEKPEGNPPADLNVGGPASKTNPGLAERWAWINKFLAGDYDE